MSFAELTINPAMAERLHRSLQRGRLAHAYLFAGGRGSGKSDLARPQTGVVDAYRLQAALTALFTETRASLREQIEAEDDLDRYSELDAKARERLEDQREARIEGEYRGAREQILEELYTWFSDILLCVEGAAPPLLAHPEQAAELQAAASRQDYHSATEQLDAIDQIRTSLSRNIAEPFALEVGLLKLVRA